MTREHTPRPGATWDTETTRTEEHATRWNGEPCVATRVVVTVADSGFFPEYWARDLVGTRRRAVRVEYGDQVFYLDDEDGSGWHKVTHGGGPGLPSRSLDVEGPTEIVIDTAGPDTNQPVPPTFNRADRRAMQRAARRNRKRTP